LEGILVLETSIDYFRFSSHPVGVLGNSSGSPPEGTLRLEAQSIKAKICGADLPFPWPTISRKTLGQFQFDNRKYCLFEMKGDLVRAPQPNIKAYWLVLSLLASPMIE
jgi:hypothetical protein